MVSSMLLYDRKSFFQFPATNYCLNWCFTLCHGFFCHSLQHSCMELKMIHGNQWLWGLVGRHTHTAHRNEHAEQQTGQGGQIARIRVSIIQNQFFLPLILLLHDVLHLFKIVTIPSRYYTNNTGNIPATTQHKTTIRLTQFGIKWWLS